MVWVTAPQSSLTMASYKNILLVMCFLLFSNAAAESVCGDFYALDHPDSGYIYSPNYPDIYPENTFCIWLIEAPKNHSLRLIINFEGERYNNACSDYIEIRHGSKHSDLQGIYCDKVTGLEMTSHSRWLWIKLKSDRLTTTGMPMLIQFTPIYSCRSYEFVCRNMECLSMSYRCDGQNDCGCLTDCDESLCEGLPISKQTQVFIAIITGVGSFCILCLVTYCIEGKNSWMAAQAEALREKEIIAEKQRQRASRAFTKFIGGEKELLLTVPKSKMNLANAKMSSMSMRN